METSKYTQFLNLINDPLYPTMTHFIYILFIVINTKMHTNQIPHKSAGQNSPVAPPTKYHYVFESETLSITMSNHI